MELPAFSPCKDFAQSNGVEDTIKESRTISIVPGLGEFPSEGGRRFEKPRITVQADGERRGHGNEPDLHHQNGQALDRELMHRLHGDVRRAVEEMHATQAANLAALSDLQTTLIRWIVLTGIVVTGIVVIALLKLF